MSFEIERRGLTFILFKPSCMKLRKNLMSYNLCDPEHYKNVVNANFEEVDDEVAIDNEE